MKLLITGSSGFIGKNLVNSLKSIHEIQSYDILDNQYKRPKDLQINQFDWVLHIGALSSTAETNIERVIDLNVSWSIELFEECLKYGVNFQWSSSASVYGRPSETKFSEYLKPNPLNLYARSKFLLEEYIKNRNADIIWQGFRYFNVYGPGEEHKGKQASPYHQFKEQAETLGVIKLFENSQLYSRDFVHVSRVCDVHTQMLEYPKSGIWNIGSGIAKSFETVANEITEQYDARIEYIKMPSNLESHYQSYTCADISKLQSVLKTINSEDI